jgi:hypothetical protein
MNLEEKINSPIFQSLLGITKHLGPFHPDPEWDKWYRTLRILGLSQKETKEILNAEIARRKAYREGFNDALSPSPQPDES